MLLGAPKLVCINPMFTAPRQRILVRGEQAFEDVRAGETQAMDRHRESALCPNDSTTSARPPNTVTN